MGTEPSIWLAPEGERSDGAPRLTPFLIDRGAPTGAVIVCPGGGYQTRAPHEGVPVAEWLNANDIAAFVLDYRVAPNRHPLPLRDVQLAIRAVRQRAAEWRVAPDHVAVLGFSAGGHLAASAATLFNRPDLGGLRGDDVRPDAAVLCYAVLSFSVHAHAGSVRNLLGDSPAPELREALSLERSITSQTPPTFLWATGDDAAVPVENSLQFAAALRAHGVPFELHMFSHGHHGLGLAPDDPVVRPWTALCFAWLRSLGYARSGE
ncbi:MAG: alpha/beta hydrolase [Chloroflexi bacterium]|nr:alpha/beta hydrolase [Chloroflexota bacterium]